MKFFIPKLEQLVKVERRKIIGGKFVPETIQLIYAHAMM